MVAFGGEVSGITDDNMLEGNLHPPPLSLYVRVLVMYENTMPQRIGNREYNIRMIHQDLIRKDDVECFSLSITDGTGLSVRACDAITRNERR